MPRVLFVFRKECSAFGRAEQYRAVDGLWVTSVWEFPSVRLVCLVLSALSASSLSLSLSPVSSLSSLLSACILPLAISDEPRSDRSCPMMKKKRSLISPPSTLMVIHDNAMDPSPHRMSWDGRFHPLKNLLGIRKSHMPERPKRPETISVHILR